MDDNRALSAELTKVVTALVDAENEKEKEEHVNNQLSMSIYTIGTKHPNVVLPALLAYWKQPGILRAQKLLILTSINAIVDHSNLLAGLDEKLAIQIIEAAVEGLAEKDLVELGSDILVTMSRSFCIEVMKQMLNLFQPGHLPTVTTFQTFGRIFSANVYDSIPFLSAVLSMLVPLLGEARSDAIKRAICGAVAQFAEALLEYVANENEAPDPGVKVSFYHNDFSSIFEFILVHWIPKIKDGEQAAYMVHATSCIAKVVSKEKLQELADRLLTITINLVRRHPHESNACEGLAIILESFSSNSRATLEPHLDVLIDVVFAQACAPPDYSKPFAVKSHNEVLRCFTILYLNFPDRIINYLLGKLSPNVLKSTVTKDSTDRAVVGALSIINKLVNQPDVSFAFYLTPLLKALEPIVSPTPPVTLSNNIKQAVAQLILTLADRLYLVDGNSAQLMEFIIRQCSVPATAIPRSPSGLESVTDESLRASCENVLHLLTTTVHGMEKILLPNLFDYLVMWPYTESVRTIAMCLVHLNTKQDVFVALKANAGGHHPTIVDLFTRLFVLAGCIMERPEAESLLQLLQLVAVRMSEAIKELWDGTVPELEKFVRQAQESQNGWDSKTWEETLLKLLQTTLHDLKNVDPDMVNRVTESFTLQIPMYVDMSNEKAFLYLALGTTLEIAADPLLVNKALDNMFASVNHQKIIERQACATSIGKASSAHFDLILSKLDAFANRDHHGKRPSFLNIFSGKEKTDVADERLKATIVLCYGHAVSGAPRALLLTRLDDVMRSVMPFFVGVRDFAIKHSLCRFAEMLAKALKDSNSALDKRQALTFNMKDFIKSEPADLRSSVRALAMTACAELALLPPKIPIDEVEDCLLLFSNSVFPLLPPRHEANNSLALETANAAYLNYEVLWEATCKALTEYMITVVKVYRNSEALLVLLKNLRLWLESDSDHERYQSLQMLNNVLLSDAVTDNVLKSVMGMIAGLLATRAMDPDVRCREAALSCGKRVASVITYGKNSEQGWNDVAKTAWLKESLSSQAYANEVASLFYTILEPEQLTKFVRQQYYQGLLEKRAVTATGVGSVLLATLKHRWSQIKDQGSEIMSGLLYALKFVKDPATKASIEGCVRSIAEHDADLVAQVLLSQPVPLHPATADLWRSLGSAPTIGPVLLAHCIQILRSTPCYSEVHISARCVNLQILQTLAALTELFQANGNMDLLQANFADIAPILIVVTAAMVGAQAPRPPQFAISAENNLVEAEWKQVYKIQPSRLAIDCLKQLLKNTNSVVPISFEMIDDSSMYAEGLHVTCKCIFQSSEVHLGRIISNLVPFLTSDLEAQRAAVVAMYSAVSVLQRASMLESKRPSDRLERDAVVDHLTTKNADQALIVRVFCIRGIGSLSLFGSAVVNEKSDTIVRIILAGLEDSADTGLNSAPVEAMKALNKILPVIDHSRIQDSLLSFAMRLRPLFESDTSMVRGMAFALFGQVAAAAEKDAVKEAFVQEIHNVLVILLLHLNDDHVEVTMSTRAVFKLLLPLLKSEGFNNAFSYPEGISYGRLLKMICSSLGTDFPDKIPMYLNLVFGYFRSESVTMRANAALLAGNLVAQATNLTNPDAMPSHISPALISLLSDKSPVVRQRAAEALGLMY